MPTPGTPPRAAPPRRFTRAHRPGEGNTTHQNRLRAGVVEGPQLHAVPEARGRPPWGRGDPRCGTGDTVGAKTMQGRRSLVSLMGKVDVGASNASAAASRAGLRATDGNQTPSRKNPRRHLREAPETADDVAEGCRKAAPRRTNSFNTSPGQCRRHRGAHDVARASAAVLAVGRPSRTSTVFAVSGRCRAETPEMGFGEQHRTRGCAEDVPGEEACFRTTLDYVLSRVPKRASAVLLHPFCCFAEPAQNWNSRV